VNGGRPPLTTVGPSLDHRSTVVDRQSTGGSWAGSGWVMGQVRFGSGSGLPRVIATSAATWHHVALT
ncbi:hypothetical protein Tco_0552365, partial [Tanacetum coccineum]